MSGDDPGKSADLKLKELEIALKHKELEQRSRFDFGRAALAVTIVASVAAVVFQGLAAWGSRTDKQRAEIEKQSAESRARSDFDFKGLELFLKEHDNLITCDVDESSRNLRLFQGLFSDSVTRGFNDIVQYRTRKCADADAEKAAQEAKNRNEKPEQVIAAADAARYAAIAQRSGLLSATKDIDQQRLRVFIHINSEEDRAMASALQAGLIQDGYAVPGIEKVSSAPSRYELRYYYNDQANEAKTLASIAAKQLRVEVQVAGPLEARFKSLPQRTAEFWFPRRP